MNNLEFQIVSISYIIYLGQVNVDFEEVLFTDVIFIIDGG